MIQRSMRIRTNLRPLRPPNIRSNPPLRSFTRPTALLRLSALSTRPQLPYLAPPAQCATPGQWQLARLMTTEKERLFRKTAWDFTTALGAVLVLLPTGIMLLWWISHELLERDIPTPHEWTFRSRCYWHHIKALQDRSVTQGRLPDWTIIVQTLQLLLKRLEDLNFDGQGLTLNSHTQQQALGEHYLDLDISRVFDISGKPEPWRRGYFQVMLEFAKAAEASEHMVYDKKSKSFFMAESVIGPSNPDPTPLHSAVNKAPPLEENCVPLSPSAESFYEKILATRGLNDDQQVETLLSYSEWLDSQERHDHAESLLRKALQISASALPNSSAIINSQTGVIQGKAPFVTQNLLDSATALGIHLAQNAKTSAALSIFLSVLQAYRSCPRDLSHDGRPHLSYSGTIPADVLMAGLREKFSRLLSDVEYPPPPPSRNLPLVRRGDEGCKEAAAIIYASELLFATSSSRQDTALKWIKEALETAEDQVSDTSNSMDDRWRCNQCIPVALDAWWDMIQQLKAEAESPPQQPGYLTSLIRKPKKDLASTWRREESEHWDWVRKAGRDNWEEKMSFEQWKMWSWMPMSTLTRVL
ncbi:hypothetical protein BT63DRAFT_419679 [Microthyrium microscopicum]|uniref:Uncharacterized protein n=1 Tax=Microthyrium microscopicum TaxID=703497 RepID=A0A6A6URK2_9PEZI|nr:hypothetical protein BT63DRAFT_419679 [Microthyrium microscopicum]